MQLTQINKKFYIPLFLLMCFSGNPFFISMSYSKILLSAYAFLLVIYFLLSPYREFVFNNINKVVATATILLLLTIAQFIVFKQISLFGVFGMIAKLLIAYLTYQYYTVKRIKFEIIYIRLMSLLTLVSIPFWLINQFTGKGLIKVDLFEFYSNVLYTVFPLKEYLEYILVRNSGMFWEPGAFAGYLLVAIVFIIMLNRKISFTNFKSDFAIISFGILTTQSTTGYIIYGIIVTIAFYITNRHKSKLILLPILIIFILLIFLSNRFLFSKVEKQYNEAQVLEKNEFSNSRFGTWVMDSQYITSQPIIGNGLDDEYRFRFQEEIEGYIGHGNGMSNFLVYWGIPFFLFWLYNLYKYLYNSSKSKYLSFFLIAIFMLMLQGEQFLLHPLFLLFFLLPLKYSTTTIQLK